jgi:hypothetical protein
MRSSQQGPESYIADGEETCKFDAARIAQYRAFATEDFGKAMQAPGPTSLDKLAKLLVLEIAYANARHTDWLATAQWAHLGAGSAGDDDDAPAASVFDFVNEWSVTEPHKVLWKDLKLSVEPPFNFLTVGQTPVYMLPALLIARHVCSECTMTPADPAMLAYYEECASQFRRIFDAEIEEFMGTDARNYKNLMQRDFTNEEMEYITELRKLCREGGKGASAPTVPASAATPPQAVAKKTRGAAAAAAGRGGGGGGGASAAAAEAAAEAAPPPPAAAAAQRRQRSGGGGGASAAPAASAAEEDESGGPFFSEGDSAFILELERLSAVERAAERAAAAAGRGGGGGAAVAAAPVPERAASGTVLRAPSLRIPPRAAQAGAGGASAGAGAASAAPPLPPRGGGGTGRPKSGGRGIRTKRQAAVLAPGERILSKRGHRESTIAADGSLEDVLELPRNPVNNRVMPTAVHLNSAFPKNYAAAHPLKEPPVALTIGQAYHAVSKTSAGRPRGGWLGLGGVDCGKGRFYPIPLNTTKCHIPVNTT